MYDVAVNRSGILTPMSLSTESPAAKTLADAVAVLNLKAQSADEEAVLNDVADGLDFKMDEIKGPTIFRNACPAELYKHALCFEPGSTGLSSTGALCCLSGEKTGRSPLDKRVVDEPTTRNKVWWGEVNIPLLPHSFMINRQRAIDYMSLQERLYVTDAYAGWDPEYRIKIRTISTRAYHALFMHNMLIRPNAEELQTFEPDFVIYNAGAFPANSLTDGVTSKTSIALDFNRMEMVILGSEYAGEMKKGVLTLMMYILPLAGHLPLHSSCNVGKDGSVTLFFGLSGTGKTTLSADPQRSLIGDDEHVWTDKGIYNIEGGCYAKCKDLSRENEREIFDAIRFGSVVENVVYDEKTHVIDFTNVSITENTRVAYPLEHIPNAMVPARIDKHPNNIIFLTCDAFGVLPPIAKLTVSQAMYHFVSGFTSKMVGTEMGINKPTATFSACYGGPFLASHPMVYAELLAKKLQQHKSNIWLVNTGWIMGSYGSESGKRIPLKYTRAIIDAIHGDELNHAEYEEMPIFGFAVPKRMQQVPNHVLHQHLGWRSVDEYLKNVKQLALEFIKNFEQYSNRASEEILLGGPQLD